MTGGPVYYIHQAFQGTFGRVLAVIFAVFIVLALGFMGNMVQSNSIGAAFSGVFESRNINIPPVAVGILLAVVVPNAMALLALSGVVAGISKKYGKK